MKRKIAVIGTVGLPANYGGFETLTEQLVQHLGESHQMTVYCSGKAYPKESRKTHYKKARLRFLPFKANGVQSILYDALSILHALFYADVLLILGVAGAWTLPFVRLFTRKTIVISIDGIEWKRAKWNLPARLYLFWAEKMAVKYSHIDISDNEAIQDYTALKYGTLSRVIEYGGDHAKAQIPMAPDLKEFSFLNSPYAFSVCRIEPENNVHLVLKAFSGLPRHTLVFVGNWDRSSYGRALKQQFGGFSHIQLLDPIYDQRKLDVLRSNAFLYVHGHSAGGTNPSLVEAMNLGLPVFAFDVSYNRVTTSGKALYFGDVQGLKNLVEEVRLPKLRSIGQRLESIAAQRYSWKLVTDKYARLFEEALAMEGKVRLKKMRRSLKDKQYLDLDLAHLNHPDPFFVQR